MCVTLSRFPKKRGTRKENVLRRKDNNLTMIGIQKRFHNLQISSQTLDEKSLKTAKKVSQLQQIHQ